MVLPPHTFRRLCEARDALTQTTGHPLTIPDLARAAHISPFHFIRRFEALFGLTPHQLRIAARLDRARILLAKGELSVTEVCMEFGFTSLGSFSASFTRRTGVSPSEYQRRARILVPVRGNLPPDLFPGCLSLMRRLPRDAFRNFGEAPARAVR